MDPAAGRAGASARRRHRRAARALGRRHGGGDSGPAGPTGGGCTRRSSRPGTSCRRRRAGARPSAHRDTRSSWRGSACRPFAPAAGVARRLRGDARGRCSPATPRTRSSRSRRGARAAFGMLLSAAATRWAGRSRGAGRSGWPTRSSRTSARSAGRCQAGAPVEHLDELRRARGSSCSTWAAAGGPARRRRLPAPVPPGARALPLRRGARSSSTGHSTGRCRGRAPECARAATVHLGGTLEEIAASEAAHERGERPRPRRSSSSCSRRCSIRSAAPAGQAHGLGLLPRPQRLDRRCHRPDRAAGRALRAGLPRADPRPERPDARRLRAPERQPHRR